MKIIPSAGSARLDAGFDPQSLRGETADTERFVEGYGLIYRVREYGLVLIDEICQITSWEGNSPKDFARIGEAITFKSDSLWTTQIMSMAEESTPYALILEAGDKGAFQLPITLIHLDVLPGIDPKDVLTLRVFCFTPSLEVHGQGEGSFSGLLVPVDMIEETENDGQIFVAGKILSVLWEERGNISVIYLVLETPAGPLPLVCPKSGLTPEQRNLLRPGNLVRAKAQLFGDVAAGKYENGIVLDLVHDLRLFRTCVYDFDFSRAMRIFADDCKYVRRGELAGIGPAGIVTELDTVVKRVEASGAEPDIVYGEVKLRQPSPVVENGEKCLVYWTPEGRVSNIICGRTDETGRLVKLLSVYDFDDFDDMRATTSFAIWQEGIPPAQPSEEEKKGYYENPELAERVHGNPESFLGEPFYGFGDVLDGFLPEDEVNLDTAIATFIRDAKACGKYVLPDKDYQGAYYDYPERNPRLGIQLATGRNLGENSFELKNFYPVMEGARHRLKIWARFDWPDRVAGFIAATWKKTSILNYFVPSYGVCNELLKPGEEVTFALAGIALTVERPSLEEFSIHKGPFYDSELARFLSENPDKTVADFPAPIVSMRSAVMTFPTETTCIYEIQGPLAKMEELAFQGRKFMRMLIPLGREEEQEEEFLVWIYVDADTIKGYTPAQGDPVHCLVWLCATVV